jgi:hypothetical protein
VADRVPVEVGQYRADPDPRMCGRVVRVVEIGALSVYDRGHPAARVEGADGRRTRVRVDRLERWPLVEGP